MRFRATATTAELLEDIDRLGAEIEPRLDLVSVAARGEWRELRSRLPTAGDLQAGFSAVSDQELAVMRAKVARFRELLGTRWSTVAGRAPAPVIVLSSVSTVARG